MLGRKLGFSGVFACTSNHQHVEKEKGNWVFVCEVLRKLGNMWMHYILEKYEREKKRKKKITEVFVLGLALKLRVLGLTLKVKRLCRVKLVATSTKLFHEILSVFCCGFYCEKFVHRL